MNSESSAALDRADRLSELLTKSIALADLLRCLGSGQDEVAEDTVSNAAWMLEDMLREVKTLTGGVPNA
jgi:hypothetical protein